MKLVTRSGSLNIPSTIVKTYTAVYRTVIGNYKRVEKRDYRIIDLDENMDSSDRFSKWSLVTTVPQKLDTSIPQNGRWF
jgi:hypothetical protein